MSLEKLSPALIREVAALAEEGRAKAPERILVGYRPAAGGRGPRYLLEGSDREFLRMNSNSARLNAVNDVSSCFSSYTTTHRPWLSTSIAMK